MNQNKALLIGLGPALFALMWGINPFGLDHAQAKVIGVLCWMLAWWITEAVPMAVTSLLPIALFPILGVMNIEKTCLSYSNRSVFLFLGGFIIALAMEKWNLHRRLALNIVNLTGNSANRIIFGFFLASYLISMWISNTATTLMMLPIASSVVTLLINNHDSRSSKGIRNFSLSVMLSIAYGSSIGGIATLVGSPPNSSMAGILNQAPYSHSVSFFDWMKMGLPFSLGLLIIAYFILVKWLFPNRLGRFQVAHELIHSELKLLGNWTTTEKRVFTVFVLTAVLWIVQEPVQSLLKDTGIQFTDTSIGIIAGGLLFLIPAKGDFNQPILHWKDSEKLPWGVLLMFGGGMSLAEAFSSSGLVNQITILMDGLDKNNLFLFVSILCATGLLLTALMSNIAMVNIFVPVVAALAVGIGISPELFAIPVTIAASCDFMFPMSTPPNAIVYSSGYVKSSDMLKAGLVLNVVSLMLLMALVWVII